MALRRQRPRDEVPALWTAIHEDFGLTPPEAQALWHAVTHSGDPQVVALRYLFIRLEARRGQPHLLGVLLEALPPRKYCTLLERLVDAAPACRRLVTRVEERILRWTSRDGEWAISIIPKEK